MTDLKAAAEAEKAAHKGGDLGAFSKAFCEFQQLATPDAILALYAERDGAFLTSQQAAQSYSNLMRAKDDIDAQRQAAEASLALYKEEVERLRRALAEARDDMQAWQSYASDYFRDKHDAAGDLAKIDQALTKEPTNA